jgi:hypothetical protein
MKTAKVIRTIPSINDYVRSWKNAPEHCKTAIVLEVKENWNIPHYKLFLDLIKK